MYIPKRFWVKFMDKVRKGIILAGGNGTRLYPATYSISKQLLPVYDKPMVYYPLCSLMQADIRDILIISTPRDTPFYENLLKDGSQWGINIEYCVQNNPDGLAQAFILGEKFINGHNSALILGDNIFYGGNFKEVVMNASKNQNGATLFAYHVNDPERYGVLEFDDQNKAISIEEKPAKPKSNYAVTGLYFYDSDVCDIAKEIKPSSRGELEITSVNEIYLRNNNLFVEKMGRGFAWLDTGTHNSLLEASQFIETIENRQGLKIACPEEISYQNSWITNDQLKLQIQKMPINGYSEYLLKVIDNK